METAKKGSALLCVLLVLSIIVPYLFTLVRGSSFAVDNALYYKKYIQQRTLAEGLLNYGISLCCCNYDKIKEKLSDNKIIMFEIENWPTVKNESNNSKEKNSKGTIEVSFSAGNIHVHVTLHNNGTPCAYHMECDLIKNDDTTTYTISNWQYETKNNT